MNKSIRHLVLNDFHISPVWKPVDDFEDPEHEVMPYLGESFNLEEMYLIAAKIKLADGSEWEGYIRFSWGKPKVLALATNNDTFLLFGAERLAEPDKRHEEFVRALDKKYDDVFPIEYQTKVKLYFQSAVY